MSTGLLFGDGRCHNNTNMFTARLEMKWYAQWRKFTSCCWVPFGEGAILLCWVKSCVRTNVNSPQRSVFLSSSGIW
jgi:hypothetical protein